MEINSQQSKRPVKSMAVARLAVLAVVFAAIGIYLYSNWAKFSDVFTSISATKITLIFFVNLLYYIVSAAVMFYAYLPYSIRLGPMEAFEANMATRFGNLLLPLRGGAVARAVYLNKRYQFTPEMFVASLSGMMLTSVFTGLLLVDVGLVFVGIHNGMWFLRPILLVTFSILVLVVLAMIRVKIKPSRNKILTLVRNLAEGWVTFASHTSCLIKLNLCYGVLIILQSCIYGIILNTDTASVHWSYIVVLIALGNVSMAFQITPGNAGVYEGLLAGISSLMGLDYQAILAAGLTWRIIDSVFVLVVGGLASRQLTKRCSSFLQSKKESINTEKLTAEITL